MACRNPSDANVFDHSDWSSTNTSVASLKSSYSGGKINTINAISTGTTQIQVSIYGYYQGVRFGIQGSYPENDYQSFNITVVEPLTDISIPTTLSLEPNTYSDLPYTTTPSSNISRIVSGLTVESSDTNIIEIDTTSGLMHAKNPGTATIKISATNSVTTIPEKICTVTVATANSSKNDNGNGDSGNNSTSNNGGSNVQTPGSGSSTTGSEQQSSSGSNTGTLTPSADTTTGQNSSAVQDTTSNIESLDHNITAPAKTKITSIKNKKSKSITVTWKKSKDAVGYEIQYATNKKFTKNKKSKSSEKLTLSIKKLKKGKTYYVRIRPYNTDSKGNKVYGIWSSIKKIKIKK